MVEKIEPDEIDQIDHLCFVIHGIGEGCDMKFRPIVDCGNFCYLNKKKFQYFKSSFKMLFFFSIK